MCAWCDCDVLNDLTARHVICQQSTLMKALIVYVSYLSELLCIVDNLLTNEMRWFVDMSQATSQQTSYRSVLKVK